MNVGDAFVNMARGAIRSHLWFVVSRSVGAAGAERVAIVNVSSGDDALGDLPTMDVGDHPWLKHTSFLRTDLARLAEVARLAAALAVRPPIVIPKDRLTVTALAKVHAALLASKYTRLEIKRVLDEQGFKK